MRNGILLNNNDKLDFTLFSFQAKLANLSVNSDSVSSYEIYKNRQKDMNLDLLSFLFLYDELYIVQPDMWVDYSKIGNYLDLHIIDEKPIRNLDVNYAAYIKTIIMQTLSKTLHIKKEDRIFSLMEETYDSMVNVGGVDFEMHEKFLDYYGNDVLDIAKLNIDVTWEDDRLLWNLFASEVCRNIWHYTNELILNIEYSSLKDLVISGSHMNYKNFSYDEKELTCYKILKITVNDYYAKTPVFANINEMIRFKEKNRTGIISLRNEISNLEVELRNFNNELVIRKAEEDVAKAQKALLLNSQFNKIAKSATYLSVPIGVIDAMLNGSYLGFSLSIVGTIATALNDLNALRNNWINIIH